jgi:hypothetical protein
VNISGIKRKCIDLGKRQKKLSEKSPLGLMMVGSKFQILDTAKLLNGLLNFK